jgi:beta-glucosidase
VYLERPPCADAPPRKLVGWAWVALEVGEKKSVDVVLDPQSLERPFSLWNPNGWELVPGEYRVHVGASSRDIKLSNAFKVNP